MNKTHKASKISKKVWAGALCAVLVTIADPVSATQAKSAAVHKPTAAAGMQQMQYDVYAGGFHVVSADLTVDTAKKSDYSIRLNANTHGMLAKLAPWDGYFESQGWYDLNAGKPQPQIHRSSSTWRGEGEIKEYRYGKDGSFVDYRIKDDKHNGTPETVDPVLTQNTTDAFSAALKVMAKISKDGRCEGSDDVFDGNRRFTQVFVHKANVELKANEYNVYSGPAVECTVEVQKGPGKWHEKPRGWMSIQEQGRERGTLPTIWFASMAPGQPAIPVKIRVKTEYGTLFMHLTGYKGGEKTLKLLPQ